MKSFRHYLSRLGRTNTLLSYIRRIVQGIPAVSQIEITQEIIKNCVGISDPVILEIGCNDGTHTLWLREAFEKPEIYCFEPDPRAIARFKTTVGQKPGVTLFEVAISDRVGQILFHQSDLKKATQTGGASGSWDYSGSIRKPKYHLVEHPGITFDRSIMVATTTLDTWCEQNGIAKIDLIWMDVQGAEIDVFRGARNSLKKARFVYTEYSNSEQYEGQYSLRRLLRYMRDFGVAIRFPMDALLWNRKLATVPEKIRCQPRG